MKGKERQVAYISAMTRNEANLQTSTLSRFVFNCPIRVFLNPSFLLPLFFYSFLYALRSAPVATLILYFLTTTTVLLGSHSFEDPKS